MILLILAKGKKSLVNRHKCFEPERSLAEMKTWLTASNLNKKYVCLQEKYELEIQTGAFAPKHVKLQWQKRITCKPGKTNIPDELF